LPHDAVYAEWRVACQRALRPVDGRFTVAVKPTGRPEALGGREHSLPEARSQPVVQIGERHLKLFYFNLL
jgi:hypothetical protein